MSVEEQALIGWREIARFLRWTESKVLSRRKELRDYGILFHTYVGKPPNRRKVVFTFPSLIQRWLILKSGHGQRI